MYIGMLNPLQLRNNLHRMKAERIPPMFHELREEFKVNEYDIVGHSIGGKIALLTAALYDDENLIRNVLALDPVDQVRTLKISCVTKIGQPGLVFNPSNVCTESC
jgi:pimeloyl-ACP methyl ester carboxylesterase